MPAVWAVMDDGMMMQALGEGAVPIVKGVCKLYRGDHGHWKHLHTGLLVWHSHKDGLSWLKLLRLSDGEVLFDEEMYENFDAFYSCKRTANGSHHFHTMEFEDYVAGVCFANEADAKMFEKMIPNIATQCCPPLCKDCAHVAPRTSHHF